MAREIDSSRTAGLLAFNGAYMAVELGRADQAAELIERAAMVYGASDPDVLIVSALVAEAQGDLAEAVRLARLARDSQDSWDDERQQLLERFERALSAADQ